MTRKKALACGCTLVSVLFALMWLMAAWGKLSEPFAAYEFAARIVGGGLPAKALVTFQVAAEALLGGVMLLGAFRGLRTSLAVLIVLTGVLFWVRSQSGGTVACGCFTILLEADVDGSIQRNAMLVVLLILAVVFDPVGRTPDPVPPPA